MSLIDRRCVFVTDGNVSRTGFIRHVYQGHPMGDPYSVLVHCGKSMWCVPWEDVRLLPQRVIQTAAKSSGNEPTAEA